MQKFITITLGAMALGVVVGTNFALARDPASIERGEQPSGQHGVQGAQDVGMGKMPTTGADFVTHAAQDGMAEVALGKLAATRSADADVKQFGQRMVDDHSKANEELTTLATSKSLPRPTDVTAKQKATADRLGKLSGAQFDKAYMQAMVGDHDHAVALFKSYSERGDDAELKAWAAKTIPTLEDHDRLAKTTATKVGVASRAVGHGTSKPAKSSHRTTNEP